MSDFINTYLTTLQTLKEGSTTYNFDSLPSYPQVKEKKRRKQILTVEGNISQNFSIPFFLFSLVETKLKRGVGSLGVIQSQL